MAGPFDMRGRTAAIIGGSRGFGRAIALAFADQGAAVLIGDDADGGAALAGELGARGARHWSIPLDIARWDALAPFVEQAHDTAGRVDIVVNACGAADPVARSIDMTEDRFDAMMARNLKAPFRLSALFGERMRAAGGGAIILVASATALHPAPALAVHAAANGALGAVVTAHAQEFGPDVRVNGIMTGDFEGDAARLDAVVPNAAGRAGRPEEIATAALYLASRQSSYTTGTVIRLDGGQL